MTLDDHVNTIQSTLESLLVKIAMTKIIAVMPLSAPIYNLIESIISKVIGYFLAQAEIKAFFVYTDFRTSKQGNEFYEAAEANYRAQQGGTDEQKKIAEANLIDSFNKFVQLSY